MISRTFPIPGSPQRRDRVIQFVPGGLHIRGVRIKARRFDDAGETPLRHHFQGHVLPLLTLNQPIIRAHP